MDGIAQLALVCVLTLGGGVLIWRLTDPDPRRLRARLSNQEMQMAHDRIPWARTTLYSLAVASGCRRVPSFGLANFGAHYSPVWHRIRVSLAFLARLSEADLRVILAHELGHSRRRLQTFFRPGAIEEEVHADAFALRLIGATPEQWEHAVRMSVAAEPNMTANAHLEYRAHAIRSR